MLFILSALTLSAAIVFGGGTRSGFMGDVAVQLFAAMLLAGVLVSLTLTALAQRDSGEIDGAGRTPRPPATGNLMAALVPLGLVALLAMVQLGPWRMSQFEPLIASGALNTWRLVTLTPHATASALVSLVAPIAIFAGVAQLGPRDRGRLAWLVIALGAVSVVLGLLQVAQGPQSALRPYEYTNTSEAVGLFANRNHFAALMYCTLVLASAVVIGRLAQSGAVALRFNASLLLAAGFVLIVSVVAALAVARSRAGLALAMASLVGIAVLALRVPRGPTGSHVSLRNLVQFAIVFAVFFALQFGLARIMSRFEADPMQDLRWELSEATLDAAWAALPLGTGAGSFVPVYAAIERPSVVHATYSNRAHNDFAEWLLEAGLVGGSMILLAFIWFAWRTWSVWRSSEATPHGYLQRAATLVVALLLTHSLVDYPLRTSAMMAVFAFAGALLVRPPSSGADHGADHEVPRRHRDDRMGSGLPGGKSGSPASAFRPRRPWGSDVQWPEAWRPGRPTKPSQ